MPAASAATFETVSTPPPLPFPEGQRWCELIEERCGLHFPESQWHFLRRRLWERVRQQGTAEGSYAQYYRLLSGETRDGVNAAVASEWKRLMEDLLNPETSFFRHRPSFDALERVVLPDLRRRTSTHRTTARGMAGSLEGLVRFTVQSAQDPGSRAPRLWSAGCSTGEEAYSLAMSALSHSGTAATVWGSDLSDASLDRARTGVFSPRQMASVAPGWRSLYFRPAQAGGYCEVAPALREAVRFAPFHLLEPASYPAGTFDVIFCCNVLVYFRRPARERALTALIGRLAPGGYLFLAPGETAGLAHLPGAEPARLEGTTVLRRAAA